MTAQRDYLLVVEDIPDTRALLEAALKYKGYRVVTARHGLEALEIIQQERPLMVITDVLMPTMDGFSLLHHLRLNPDTRTLPVVFLTATYVAQEDKAFANSIGVTYFIEKPFDMDRFLQVVGDLLAQGARPAPEPLKELDFYREYRKRLEAKLQQKVNAISQDQVRLESLPAGEAPAIKTDLSRQMRERDDLQLLLQQIQEHLTALTDPD